MGSKLEPLELHGTEKGQINISAVEILDAIAEGRNVSIEHAVITGYLDIQRITERLKRIGYNAPIRGNIEIRSSEITGDVSLRSAHFNGNVCFDSTTFKGK